MTGAIHRCYELMIEYKQEPREDDQRPRVRTMFHVFTADDEIDAMRCAVAFWKGRVTALPQIFHKLYCMKVCPYGIGPITGGQLHNGRKFDFFEYKIDTAGRDLDAHLEARIEDFERYRKGK